MNKALADLNAAKAEIEKLRKIQADAQLEVQKATQSVKAASSNQANGVNYADQGYWESRYKKKSEIENTYEWYLPFETAYRLISKDLKESGFVKDSKFLVPGCGNSTLCEDLYKQGHQHVSGMDYSVTVVNNMQIRANELQMSSIRYFQADARHMQTEPDLFYDVVVDKGTLDAIASGGDNNKNIDPQMADAALYMREMWRVLTLNGLFIVVTTMPPDVLAAIAIEPITGGGNVLSSVVNWNSGHVSHKLQTPEGGDIYYYALRKLGNLPAVSVESTPVSGLTRDTATARLSQLSGSGSGSDIGSREAMMSGIAALIEEAKKAAAAVQEAASKQVAAASDLSAAESKRAEVSRLLNSDLTTIGGGVDGAVDTASDREMDVEEQELVDRANMPTVRLLVDSQSSNFATGGSVEVSFLLTAASDASTGCWDEDDALSLVVHRAGGADSGDTVGGGSDDSMYLSGEQTSEAFEYTSKPAAVPVSDVSTEIARYPHHARLDAHSGSGDVATRPHFTGRCNISLPSYGGLFHVSYVRTVTVTVHHVDPATGVKTVEYKRIPVTLAQSALFSVRCPLYFHAPDFRPPSGVKPAHPVVRRRGAGDMCNKRAALDVLVEDMASIRTVNVTAALPPDSSGEIQSVARVMAWLFDASDLIGATQSGGGSAGSIQLVLEMDVVTCDQTALTADSASTISASSVRTLYHTVSLPDNSFGRVSGLVSDSAWAEVDSLGRIIVRFTYSSNDSNRNSNGGENQGDTTTSLQESSLLSIHCGFCDHKLLSTSHSIRELRPMPTGIFDNMMHDFICCEEMPTQALTSNDIATPRNALLHSQTFLTVHPDNTATGAYRIECKVYSTLLDLYTLCGATLATAPLFAKQGGSSALRNNSGGSSDSVSAEEKENKISRGLKGIINADSCAIICSRCTSYLGDGQLNKDSCDPANCEHPDLQRQSGAVKVKGSNSGGGSGVEETLSVQDVNDMRFARHCVRVSGAVEALPADTTSHRSLANLTIEQAVARTIAHLHGVYDVSSFCLYLGARPTEDVMAMDGSRALFNRVIAMKLINKDYRAAGLVSRDSAGNKISFGTQRRTDSEQQQSQVLSCAECIKVSFQVGDAAEVLTGGEARIPLQFHEWNQILSAVTATSHLFGSLKNNKLAVLMK